MTRIRTKGAMTPALPFGSRGFPTNCSSPTWTNWVDVPTYHVLVGEVTTMTDTVVPDFRKRTKNGEVFFNPMQRNYTLSEVGGNHGWTGTETGYAYCPTVPNKYQYVWEQRNNYTDWFRRSHGLTADGTRPQIYIISDGQIKSAQVEASTKVQSNRSKPDTNMFESLAQYNLVLGMTRSAFDNAHKAIGKIPGGKIVGAASAYLLYRYGLKPLVGDIQACVKALEVAAEKVRKTTRENITLESNSSQDVIIVGNSRSNVTIAQSVNDTVKVRAMSLDEFLMTKSFTAGFSLTNLATTPWELIPFSFVADWFINVGDYIGTFVPTPGFTQLGSALVTERATTSLIQVVGMTPTPGYSNIVVPTSFHRLTTVTKTRVSGLPAAGLVSKYDWKFDRNHLTRIGDASALIYLLLMGGSPKRRPKTKRMETSRTFQTYFPDQYSHL